MRTLNAEEHYHHPLEFIKEKEGKFIYNIYYQISSLINLIRGLDSVNDMDNLCNYVEDLIDPLYNPKLLIKNVKKHRIVAIDKLVNNLIKNNTELVDESRS